MKTVGICGKIGSGKSAVGVILEQQGALVLDLDMEMHALYAESRELRNRIEARFGSGCIQNGMVNRVALASLVFREPAALQDLESLVYPLLRRRVEEKLEIAKDHAHLLRMAAVEGALLFKWPDFAESLSEIWVVEAPDTVRLERLLKRGLSKEDAERRMQVQAKDPLPRNAVYRFVENSGTISDLQKRVLELAEKLKP